jgi:ribonuclease P protein component
MEGLVQFLNHETHLPTFQAHAQAAVRIPGSDENQIGPGDFVAAAPAGAQAASAQGSRGSLRPPYGGLRGPEGMDARMHFPRGARLRRSSEFARVRTTGRHVHGRLMRVSAAAAPDGAGPVRHGIVTPRRVGCAVARNRVRRRLREIIRCAPRTTGGWWVVTLAKPAAAAATFSELRDEWLLLARRLSILPASA